MHMLSFSICTDSENSVWGGYLIFLSPEYFAVDLLDLLREAIGPTGPGVQLLLEWVRISISKVT